MSMMNAQDELGGSMRKLWVTGIVMSLILLIGAGCAPQTSSGQAQATPIVLPTRIPTQTPEYNDETTAEAVALTYLSFWEEGRYEDMYDLLSPASKQAGLRRSYISS